MMIRCFFNPSLQQSGCCHGLKKPAFESPKRGLSVTDTPAGGPTSVLFASSVENSFRRLTTTPYERTMRNGRLNECFSFPRFLVIMGTRVPCDWIYQYNTWILILIHLDNCNYYLSAWNNQLAIQRPFVQKQIVSFFLMRIEMKSKKYWFKFRDNLYIYGNDYKLILEILKYSPNNNIWSK